jgi:hypothetical protein
VLNRDEVGDGCFEKVIDGQADCPDQHVIAHLCYLCSDQSRE